jgi:hypothetical protein
MALLLVADGRLEGGNRADFLSDALSSRGFVLGQTSPPEPEEVVTNPLEPKKKLDARSRRTLFAALLAITLLGLLLIVLVIMSARMTRRHLRTPLPARPIDPVFTDDWASKPLTPAERERLDAPEW